MSISTLKEAEQEITRLKRRMYLQAKVLLITKIISKEQLEEVVNIVEMLERKE